MRDRRYVSWLLFLVLTSALCPAQAADAPAFQEARFEGGELKYVNRVPLLIVDGSPEEMGRQEAALTGAIAKSISDYPRQLMKLSGRGNDWDRLVESARSLMSHAAPDERTELSIFAEKAGIAPDLLTVANTIMDLHRGGYACSSLMIEPGKSSTGGVIFGRNLDFYTLGVLDRYGLVTVHRPKDKHAFATVGFPGLTGCISGMNDAGLAIAVHEVRLTADGSPLLNLKGMPYTLAFRQVLEDCTTIGQAEKFLSKTERSSVVSLSICDRKGCGVLEITPKNVVLRRGEEGICVNTNHFRSDALSVLKVCPRYPVLSKAAAIEKPGVDDVFKKLDEVNLGPLTIQSMVFEPDPLILHVAMGGCPATKRPLEKVELKEFFGERK